MRCKIPFIWLRIKKTPLNYIGDVRLDRLFHSFDVLLTANGNTMLESFPEASSRQSSARTPERITKDNVEKLNEDGSEYYDDTDDYDRELQHLQDNKIGTEDNTSPPPTLDESLSDHNPSPAPIVATVTLKTLDSPRSFTTTSRPANDMTDVALSNFSTDLGNDILSESSSTPTSTQQLCEPDGTIVCDVSIYKSCFATLYCHYPFITYLSYKESYVNFFIIGIS